MERRAELPPEQELIALIKAITSRGNSVEVKQIIDGEWTVYEVKKKKYSVKK